MTEASRAFTSPRSPRKITKGDLICHGSVISKHYCCRSPCYRHLPSRPTDRSASAPNLSCPRLTSHSASLIEHNCTAPVTFVTKRCPTCLKSSEHSKNKSNAGTEMARSFTSTPAHRKASRKVRYFRSSARAARLKAFTKKRKASSAPTFRKSDSFRYSKFVKILQRRKSRFRATRFSLVTCLRLFPNASRRFSA